MRLGTRVAFLLFAPKACFRTLSSLFLRAGARMCWPALARGNGLGEWVRIDELHFETAPFSGSQRCKAIDARPPTSPPRIGQCQESLG